MSAISLRQLLTQHRCGSNEQPNVVSLPPNRGKWCIPRDRYQMFLEQYAASVESGGVYQFTEQHEQYRPMVIDLDFKHNSPTDERLYTDDDILSIVQMYNDQIRHYFDTDYAMCYVFEKPAPVRLQGGVLKDGIHLMYPDIVSRQNVQLEIRENVVEQLKSMSVLSHLMLSNSIDDVVDEAVIAKSGWMLYGSSKQDQHPYKLTRMFDLQCAPVDVPREAVAHWVKLFSVRNYTQDDETALKTQPVRKPRGSAAAHPADILQQQGCDADQNTVEQLVQILDPARADKRDTWLEVGICLFNINPSYIGIWINFSKQSDKFAEGVCEREWKTFNPRKDRKLQIGTLYYWAQRDNPERCREIRKTEVSYHLVKSLDCTHYEVASVMYAKYGTQFVCVDLRKNVWYRFEQARHRWTIVVNGSSLKTLMSESLAKDYMMLSEQFKKSSLASPDDSEIKGKVDACAKLIKYVKDNGFKRSVLNECMDIFYNQDFVSELDSNMSLIGFKNGVYDLSKLEFRDGKPDDYVSFTTGIEYHPYNHNEARAREILRFLKQVLPDQDVERYVLKLIASFLHGSSGDQKFHIWTGSGSNGKSCLMDLIETTFGDYSIKLPVTVLTHRRGGSSSATPEIAKTKGRRFASFQEPEKDDKIHVGYMKELSGGDTIMARGLYGDPVEFKPMFKMVLACNDLPEIPSNDGGTWRRLRVVHFPSKFVDEPDPDDPRQFKIDRNIGGMVREWRATFMALLLHRYALYKEEGLKAPPSVMAATDKYRRNNDIFLEYIKENLEYTNSEKDRLLLNDAYAHYKMWYQDAFSKRAPSRMEFRDYLDGYYGKSTIRGGGWPKVQFKGDPADEQGQEQERHEPAHRRPAQAAEHAQEL